MSAGDCRGLCNGTGTVHVSGRHGNPDWSYPCHACDGTGKRGYVRLWRRFRTRWRRVVNAIWWWTR